MSKAAALALLCALAACGGGGEAPRAGITGQVVKGPVEGAQVCAYEMAAAGKGRQLACSATAADGSYALSLDFEGDAVIEAAGGSYVDEATAQRVALGTPLASLVRVNRGGTVTAAVTPLTHFAYSQAARGPLSAAAFHSASAVVRSAFQLPAFDLVAQVPVAGPEGAGDDYGRALWTVSRAMRLGATLEGLARGVGQAGTTLGLRSTRWCKFDGNSGPYWTANVEIVPAFGSPGMGTGPMTPLIVIVDAPAESWRADVLAGRHPPSCFVVPDTAANSKRQVWLLCDAAAQYAGVHFLGADSAADYQAAATGPGVLLAAGETILASGWPIGLASGAQQRVEARNGTVYQSQNWLPPDAIDAAQVSVGPGTHGCGLNEDGSPRPVVP